MQTELITASPTNGQSTQDSVHEEGNGTHEQARVPRLKDALDRVERQIIVEALTQAKGNQAKAARALGITDRIMGLRIGKYGLDRRRFR